VGSGTVWHPPFTVSEDESLATCCCDQQVNVRKRFVASRVNFPSATGTGLVLETPARVANHCRKSLVVCANFVPIAWKCGGNSRSGAEFFAGPDISVTFDGGECTVFGARGELGGGERDGGAGRGMGRIGGEPACQFAGCRGGGANRGQACREARCCCAARAADSSNCNLPVTPWTKVGMLLDLILCTTLHFRGSYLEPFLTTIDTFW
jgi:hypothetical protein